MRKQLRQRITRLAKIPERLWRNLKHRRLRRLRSQKKLKIRRSLRHRKNLRFQRRVSPEKQARLRKLIRLIRMKQNSLLRFRRLKLRLLTAVKKIPIQHRRKHRTLSVRKTRIQCRQKHRTLTLMKALKRLLKLVHLRLIGWRQLRHASL